jgi:polyisoprenyl-phosphate glycosyltransferase
VTDLSIVVPVRNEEENVAELVARLEKTLESMGGSYEIVFVTDVNRDDTFGALKRLHAGHPAVKVIKLSSGFGQHVAVYCGLQFSSGRAVVIMDGDLQDLPEDIPLLCAKMSEGFDVVYAAKERKNESAFRNLLSKTFVKVLNTLSDYPLEYNTAMFRLISRRTVNELLKFQEREPSLTALISLIGFPSASVPVGSGTRSRGETNYSFVRQVNFAIGFLLSFSTKPLRLMSGMGLVISALGFAYLFYVVVGSIFRGTPVMGWPTLVSLVTFFGGVQLVALGVMGEYVGRIFLQTKNRPRFFIEEKVGDFL